MNKSPAFQWYPRDILSSARVQELTLEEEGAYRRLLDFCWLNGSIPADPERCARLIGKGASTCIASAVQPLFTPHPDDPTKLIHDRLELEREKQEDNRNKKKAAAEARWSGKKPENDAKNIQKQFKSNAPALQAECLSSSSSIASSSTKEKKVSTKPPADERSRHPAIAACRSVVNRFPDKALYDRLIEVLGESPDLEKLKACREEWTKRGFNPNAWTWAIDWYAAGIPQSFNGNGVKHNANAINATNGNHSGASSGDCGFQASARI